MSRGITVGGLIALLAIVGLVRARTIANFDQRQEGNLNVQIDVKDVQIVALVGSDKLEDFMNYDYYDYADFTIKPGTPSTTTTTTTTTTSKPLIISSSSSGSSTTTSPPIAVFNSGSSSSAEPSSTTDTSNAPISDPSASSSSSSIEPSSSSGQPIDSTESSSDATSISSSSKPIEQSEIVIAIDIETSSVPSDVPSTPISTAITSDGIIEGVNMANKIEGEKQQQQHLIEAADSAAMLAAANEGRPDGVIRPPATGEPRKRCPVGFLLKSGRCFKRRLSLISPRLAFMKLAPALLGKSGVLSGNLDVENS